MIDPPSKADRTIDVSRTHAGSRTWFWEVAWQKPGERMGMGVVGFSRTWLGGLFAASRIARQWERTS